MTTRKHKPGPKLPMRKKGDVNPKQIPAKTAVPGRGRGATKLALTRQAESQQAIFRGMLIYIQNPGLNLRKVWDTGRLNDDEEAPYLKDMCSWQVFERHAIAGKWRTKRDEHWAEIEKRVLAQAQSDTVEVMLREMEVLSAVADSLIANITGVTDASGNVIIEPAKPKSLEGVVNALTNLDKWRQAKRDRVMAHMAAAAGEEAAEEGEVHVVEIPHVEDNLNDEEIEHLAVVMASQRAGLLTDSEAEADVEE